EHYADGLATDAELTEAWERAKEARTGGGATGNAARAAVSAAGPGPGFAAASWARHFTALAAGGQGRKAGRTELAAQARFARCLVGDPFRPVAVVPSWRSPDVVALARQVYETRDFTALPVLADLLEDAGADPAVLAHCRGGEHARGCFVLDLLLGKS